LRHLPVFVDMSSGPRCTGIKCVMGERERQQT
jgi:hypothetical protein